MTRLHLVLTILLICASSPARANSDSPFLLQKPTLNRTHIIFVHAGDLWSVGREGGEAKRLTVSPGLEDNPMFSPDGSQVAFNAEYDGNIDVFVMPSAGGVPKRLSWHPAADIVLGWTPDGKRVLFSSSRTAYSFFAELFTVDLDGRFPERVNLPMGFEGAYSLDGSQLAYVPLGRAFTAWKRYRGGKTTPIWIATLASGKVVKVPRENSNDFCPMWVGDKVFFLSDRSGPVTLFSYDPKTKQVKQIIEHHGLDLKSASAGPDAIIYEQFGALHLYDVKSGKTKPVTVQIAADLLELRPRMVDVSKRLRTPHISPTGARGLFEARGEILTLPAEKGDARNLTNTTGVMERDPAWSPDGKTIAYFSDESGEYELHLRAQNGMGEVRKIKLAEKPGFYFTPQWSPDSKHIAYVDNHQSIWYVSLDQPKPVRVDKDRYWTWGGAGALTPVWSPDNKWLAYARRQKNYMNAIYLYSLADAKSTQVTDGMSDARYPAFDKDGKYLYFTASTDAGASLQPDIHSFTRPVSRSLYLLVLSKDDPSPLAPESDEEKGEDKKPETNGQKQEAASDKTEDKTQKPEGEKAESKSPEADKPKAVTVKLDFENIDQRILALPMPARRYVSLQVGKPGVLYAWRGLRLRQGWSLV